MKRKDYQELTMKVVKLEQKCSLLSGSGESAGAPSMSFIANMQSFNGAGAVFE